MLGVLNIGSAQYAVKVDAEGLKNGRSTGTGIALFGENESFITAQTAAAAAFHTEYFIWNSCLSLNGKEESLA